MIGELLALAFLGKKIGDYVRRRREHDDSNNEASELELDANGTFVTDDCGVQVRIRFADPLPKSCFAVTRIIDDSDEFVKGAIGFRDNDGDFVVSKAIIKKEARFYIPFGAVKNSFDESHVLRTTVVRLSDDEELELIGRVSHQLELPTPRRWNMVQYLSPLVSLCMAIARADGTLTGPRVRAVKDFICSAFELTARQTESLRTAMKRSPISLAEAIEGVRLRFPQLDPGNFIAVLANIARSDNGSTREAGRCIQEVALTFGFSDFEWEEPASAPEPSVVDDWSVLGIPVNSSVDVIKAAYRALVKQYHPDIYARSPKEIIQAAEKKMIEITAAHDRLMKLHGA